jgi:hypothetical protein
MNPGKFSSNWILILVFGLSACAPYTPVRHDFAMTSDLNEQCKILNKKRLSQSSLSKFNGTIVRKRKTKVRNPVPENKIERTDIQRMKTPVSVSKIIPQPTILTQNKKSARVFTALDKRTITPQKKSFNSTGKPEAKKLYITSEESLQPDLKSLKSESESNWVFYILAISAASSMLLISGTKKRAKRISTWASKNPWKARGIITATHVGIGLSALFIGNQLSEQGMMMSGSSKYAVLSALTAAIFLYPSGYSEKGYLMRKMCDVVLFTSGVALMIQVGDQYSSTVLYRSQDTVASHTITNNDYSHSPVVKLPSQEPVKKKNLVGKIFLTLLAVGIFVGLTGLLAILSCNIACSGSEAAAAVVGIGGEIGLLALLVFMIKSIFGKAGKKKKEKVQLQEI